MPLPPTGMKVSLAAVYLGVGREVVPAQTEIESEVGSGLPVVLEIRAPVPAMVVGGGDVRARIAAHPTYVADAAYHRCDRRKEQVTQSGQAAVLIGNVGVLSGEVEIAATLWGLRNISFEIIDLKSGLESMVAKNLRDRVGAFDAVDVLQGRRVIAHPEVGQAINGDGREAAVVRDLRHALDAELRGNSEGISVERLLQLIAVHHSRMHFVGQRGREDMCITNSPCIRGKSIVAAAGLADSDARETGRNHGAIEAAVKDSEDDVVGIDVLVDTNVVSIGSMGLFRYIEEVIRKAAGRRRRIDAEQSDGIGVEPGRGDNVQQSFLPGGSEVGDAGKRPSRQSIGGGQPEAVQL